MLFKMYQIYRTYMLLYEYTAQGTCQETVQQYKECCVFVSRCTQSTEMSIM